MQLEPIRVQNLSGSNAVSNPTVDGTLNVTVLPTVKGEVMQPLGNILGFLA